MTTKVRGLAATSKALLSLTPEIRGGIEKALDKGADEIAATARRAVPQETGELAGAIEVRDTPPAAGGGAVGNFARSAGGGAGLTRWIGVFPTKRGDPGWYAVWVEFGTRHARAQPFMRPARQLMGKRARNRIKRAVSAAVKQVARSSG